MKTYLIINRDDVLFNRPLQSFLTENSHLISKVYFTNFFPPQANKKEYILKSLLIMGPLFFVNYLLKGLYYKLTQKNIYTICANFEIPCAPLADINSAHFREEVVQNNVRTILSITSQLYQKQIIEVPGLKIYNFHPSILPNNKGRFPLFWAIYKDEIQGMTCHRVTPKIDAGEIIHQRIIKPQRKKNIRHCLNLMLSHMGSFMNESFTLIQQQKKSPPLLRPNSFYGKTPTMAEIIKFHRNNFIG